MNIEGLTDTAKNSLNEIGSSKPEVSNMRLDTSGPLDFSRPTEIDNSSENSKLDTSKEQDYSRETERKDDSMYSDYDDRWGHTPKDSEKGTWEGERGESVFVPNDTPDNKEINDSLKAKDLNGLEYKDACADFSSVAEETVEINNMTNDRYGKGGNFEQAYSALADKFNAEIKDGKTDWTTRDVWDWSKDTTKHDGHTLTVHERNDLKTCDFVRSDLHEFFTHSGGVGEYNAKIKQFNNGGFDE